MRSNTIFFGWNRPIPGRERISAEHFQNFNEYLGKLQQQGTIQSFDAVFLDAHGGDLNGFFLIKGDGAKISDLVASNDWIKHQTRALLHLEGCGAVLGVSGDASQQRFKLWTDSIPS